jgi:hypothetical protein
VTGPTQRGLQPDGGDKRTTTHTGSRSPEACSAGPLDLLNIDTLLSEPGAQGVTASASSSKTR